MDHLQTTDDIFFRNDGLDRDTAEAIVRNALVDADDGELFLEMRHSEMLMIDDGRLKSASYDQSSGFGLRAIAGEAHGYAHAGELTEAALQRAADSVSAVTRGYSGVAAQPPVSASNMPLYTDGNPLVGMPSRTRSVCFRKSTPMRALPTRGWCRSAPRSRAAGRRCRSSAPTVTVLPISGRLSG